MDFERAIIKAAFHDIPIGLALKHVRSKDDHSNVNLFKSCITDIIRHNEQNFTTSEIEQYVESVFYKIQQHSSSWLKPISLHLFNIIPLFTNEVLANATTDSDPKLKFPHLLRWQMLNDFVDEDLLCCYHLAQSDTQNLNSRKNFTWSDKIDHNNTSLNDILSQGLSDIHSHLFATADIFALNWFHLMNHPQACFQDKMSIIMEDGSKSRLSQNRSFSFVEFQCDFTPRQLCLVAAALRAYIWENLNGKKWNDPIGHWTKYHAFENSSYWSLHVGDLNCHLQALRMMAYHNYDGKAFDYAILPASYNLKSPYAIHIGERKLLYDFFKSIIGQDTMAQHLAPFFYLYLLIKAKIRSEFIQNNRLIGFKNFQLYQDRKDAYLTPAETSIGMLYAVQSALGKENQHYLEARVSPKTLPVVMNMDFSRSVLTKDKYLKNNYSHNLTWIVHFIKRSYTEKIRYEGTRKDTYAQVNELLMQLRRQSNKDDKEAKLVGIDAAGNELASRPEAFGYAFRYAQRMGLRNITYHVGEDFTDLLDGLRAIDEAILFLNLKQGHRLGHALALGIEADSYYQKRHYKIIAQQQNILDNFVWALYASAKFNLEIPTVVNLFLQSNIKSLLRNIGYNKVSTDIYDYWQSMLLRGNACVDDSFLQITPTQQEMINHYPASKEALKSSIAKELFRLYLEEKRIQNQGNKIIYVVVPIELSKVADKLQHKMLEYIENLGIVIECNPTSNLKIGPFYRYDQHPIFRFKDWTTGQHHVGVSINTDDRGIFSTSIQREYSLIALAMEKVRNFDGKNLWGKSEIIRYLSEIKKDASNHRFKPIGLF